MKIYLSAQMLAAKPTPLGQMQPFCVCLHFVHSINIYFFSKEKKVIHKSKLGIFLCTFRSVLDNLYKLFEVTRHSSGVLFTMRRQEENESDF